jgi:7-keto-8-aminopelargonate synthetase-like enzyme
MTGARSFIFSTSLPPAVAGACTRAIDIVDTRSKNRRKKLWKNTQRLLGGLQSLGYDTLGSETPIIPLYAGSIQRALTMGRYLLKERIFAPAIRPPTVPEGMCRIRFSVTAGHTNDDIDYVLEKMGKF